MCTNKSLCNTFIVLSLWVTGVVQHQRRKGLDNFNSYRPSNQSRAKVHSLSSVKTVLEFPSEMTTLKNISVQGLVPSSPGNNDNIVLKAEAHLR